MPSSAAASPARVRDLRAGLTATTRIRSQLFAGLPPAEDLDRGQQLSSVVRPGPPLHLSRPRPPLRKSSPWPPKSRSRPRLPLIASPPSEPIKRSRPPPPMIVSFPEPPSTRSAPAPVQITSLPAPANTWSLPLRATIASARVVPWRTSSPGVPRIVGAAQLGRWCLGFFGGLGVVGFLLITVVSVSRLLVASVSSALVSEAVLDAVPEWEALTMIVTLAEAALFTWPRSQVILLPDFWHVPAEGVAE